MQRMKVSELEMVFVSRVSKIFFLLEKSGSFIPTFLSLSAVQLSLANVAYPFPCQIREFFFFVSLEFLITSGRMLRLDGNFFFKLCNTSFLFALASNGSVLIKIETSLVLLLSIVSCNSKNVSFISIFLATHFFHFFL